MFDNPIVYLVLISLLTVVAEWIGKRRRRSKDAERAEEEDVLSAAAAPPAEEVKTSWDQRLQKWLNVEEAPVEVRTPSEPRRELASGLAEDREPDLGTDVAFAREFDQTPTQPLIPSVPLGVDRRVPPLPTAAKTKKRPRRSDRFGKFRGPEALKDAVVAAVVLGPSKGNEERSDILRF